MNKYDLVKKTTLEEVAKFSSQRGCEGCPLNEGIACFSVCFVANDIIQWLNQMEGMKNEE